MNIAPKHFALLVLLLSHLEDKEQKLMQEIAKWKPSWKWASKKQQPDKHQCNLVQNSSASNKLLQFFLCERFLRQLSL